MSFKSLRLNCLAGGDNYYSYGGTNIARVDAEGKAPCPLCGKIVKLRAYQPGFRRFIPAHHKRETSKT